jgi:hypothetical protein
LARKTAGDLEQQRNGIKRRYKRGKKVERVIRGEDAMSETELLVKQEVSTYLKAQDFSYSYIADALGVKKDTVKRWYSDESLDLHAKVTEIQQDFIGGAVKLLKTYAIELVEMLVEIARTTDDDKIAIQAITEALDRMGLAKVNKSESAVVQTNHNEIDIVDKTGFVAAMEQASPEAAAAVAAKLDEALAIAAEHTERDVTHA